MAKKDTPAAEAKTFEIKFPSGASVTVKRPTNGARRLMATSPFVDSRMLIEAITAYCVTKVVLPADYCDEYPEGATLEFPKVDEKGEDDSLDPLPRVDSLSYADSQLLTEAFKDLFSATQKQLEATLEGLKAVKK